MLNLYPPSAHSAFKGERVHFPSSIDQDCETIHHACKGMGTNEKTLTSVLGPKSPDQRNMIILRYKELFKTNLNQLVTSETSGDYGKLLSLITQPLPEAEAEMLRDATKGLTTTDKMIFPIIIGRTGMELNVLRKTYYQITGKDLIDAFNHELHGGFKRAILAYIQSASQDFNAGVHTQNRAEEDADALYQAGQAKTLGKDEGTILKILTASPPKHLKEVNAVYVQKYQYSLTEAVEKEFHGDEKRALVFLTRMVLEPLELLAEFFESTMSGMRTDELGLSAAVVRYHCILPQIKDAYRKMYSKDLRDRIQGETSGDYQALLLAILDAPIA